MKYMNMTEALRQVRERTPKHESTCPKCEGEACECPQNETLEVTNADKAINSTAYQNYNCLLYTSPSPRD